MIFVGLKVIINEGRIKIPFWFLNLIERWLYYIFDIYFKSMAFEAAKKNGEEMENYVCLLKIDFVS